MNKNRNLEINLLLLESEKAETSLGYLSSMHFLELAHVISQPQVVPHLKVHFRMLTLACRHGQWLEFLGQIPRIFLAAPGSLLGLAPKGNVGSTKMGIFEKLED